MKKLKVLTVVGTRPEIIRLACVLNALDANQAIDHTLVHTGQNYDYELNEIFFCMGLGFCFSFSLLHEIVINTKVIIMYNSLFVIA